MKCKGSKLINPWNLEAKRHVSAALTHTTWQLRRGEARELSIPRSERITRSFNSIKGVQSDQRQALSARFQQHLDKAVAPETQVNAIATLFKQLGG